MTTQQQELYAFHHLSLIDMQRTWESLESWSEAQSNTVRNALFRDAIVCYACPFKTNRGIHGKLILDQNLIPDALRAEHNEVIALRDQIVAHNDLNIQNLNFGPGTCFTVNGYENIHKDYLVEPLKRLSHAVHSSIMNKMHELEKEGL